MKRASAGLDALGAALMRSGLYRSYGVVFVLGLNLVGMLIRRGAFEGAARTAFTVGPVALVAGLLAYEAGVVWVIRRAMRRERAVSAAVWVVTTILECSMPTAAVVAVWWTGMRTEEQALIIPAVFAYCFFIVLSILQVRPWFAALTGGLCFAEYLGLVLAAMGRGVFDSPGSMIPAATMLMYPVVVAMVGVCAVFVSMRVRRYVETAVREGALREEVEREVLAASRVQAGVLPREAPRIGGYEIAGWTRPAAHAGGDYYDWVEQGDGGVVVSIADVAGHGLGPALITAYCRAYARSTVSGGGGLGEALTRLNALVYRDVPPDRFVTFAAVRVTPGAEAVEVLSAGHGPIVHHRAGTGEVRVLDADGLPLGVVGEAVYGDGQRVRMERGDALVLTTDGLVEAFNETGEAWGLQRLRAAVAGAGAGDASARERIELLVGRVEAFVGDEPQSDDMTVVVIRKCGEGAA